MSAMAWTEIPTSALRTMTWPELLACEDDAVATGDEHARRAASEEMRRRCEARPLALGGEGARRDHHAAAA